VAIESEEAVEQVITVEVASLISGTPSISSVYPRQPGGCSLLELLRRHPGHSWSVPPLS